MRLLLDTHILLWALTDHPQLSEEAKKVILKDDSEIYVSVLSLWEIEIKRLLKPEQLPFSAQNVYDCCIEAGYKLLLVEPDHVFQLSQLKRSASASRHKDPFDRMLLCQAMAENMNLMTHDSKIAEYDIASVILV